jgi:hypothetical protein
MIFKAIFTLAVASALGLAVLGNFAEDDAEDNDDNEVNVTLDEVPAAVKAAILKATEGATIEEIEKETENGQEVFEVEAVVRDVEFELTFDANGNLLEFEIEDEGDDDDGDDEEDEAEEEEDADDEEGEEDDADDDEESIPLSDVPPKARAAILAHAGAAEIAEVEVEEEGGVKFYEAEWTVDGAEHEVVVSAEGELVAQEEEIPLSAAPGAVQQAVKQAFPTGSKISVDKVIVVVYEVEAKVGDEEEEILVISTGQRIEIELDDDDDDDDDDDGEEGEDKEA